jgi:hypothetical protein
MNLPESFCWTRFGFEAGQSPTSIVARKERERLLNQGLFLWGIGNAVGAGIEQLVRSSAEPMVLFSPIRCAPRVVDVRPSEVVAWSVAHGIDGAAYTLPPGSLVTSRRDRESKTTHYALVCFAEDPLTQPLSKAELSFPTLTNLVSGKRVGASQVTAVVKRTEPESDAGPRYEVAIWARLVEPYFLRLTHPISV